MGRQLLPGWPERPGAGALRACCSAGAAGGGGACAPFRPCACAACCATRPDRSAAVQRPPTASSRGQPRGSCRKGTPGGCRRASAVQQRNGSDSSLPRLRRSLEQFLPRTERACTPRCQACSIAQLHAPAPSPTLRTCSCAAPGAAPLPPAAVCSRPGTRRTCPGLRRARATVPGSASARGASSRCRRRAAAERRLAACPHPRGRSGRRGALLQEGWAKGATGCEASADERKRTSGQVPLQQADCPCDGPHNYSCAGTD